jgi:serine/threonine protein kinase
MIGKELGKGHTARVFEGRTQEGEVVAIKCINPGRTASRYYSSEIKALDSLSGLAYVVQLRNHHLHLDAPAHLKSHQIVLEYCPNGDLHGLVEKYGMGIPESLARTFARQILISVNSFHSRGIAHMDIKLENIMLQSEGDLSVVKLIDFGLSRNISCSEDIRSLCSGTPFYIAPEVINL